MRAPQTTAGGGRRPAVHQFHPSIAYGDAVSNGLLLTQELLRRLGFDSEIYVAQHDPRLAGVVRDYRDYPSDAGQVLLVHHSLGHDLFDWVCGLPDRKVLVYHNITPPHFFPDDDFLRRHAVLGREQLVHYRTHVEAALCDSPYNAEELVALGYEHVVVLPMLLDVERVRQAAWNPCIVDDNAGIFTVLFVGRVERNKSQDDVIAIYTHVQRWLGRPAQLVLVGATNPYVSYIHDLQQRVAAAGISEQVRFTGHVTADDLLGWYRAADVFLCMSEHEGFGVPLIEAMALGVPVVAHASSNVPHTLAGAGILVEGKPLEETAAVVCMLAEDHAFRRRVVAAQHRRCEDFSIHTILPRLVEVLASLGVRAPAPPATADRSAPRPRIQIEGPFETSYSLAIVNRELALALEADAPGDVALRATEGPGDYEPDAAAIAALPDVELLWKRGRKGSLADVVVRNLYPPRVADMDGVTNLLYFFWEESALPLGWAEEFNRHLDGVCVASSFVKKVLVDAGVDVPVFVIGAGVDHVRRVAREPYPGSLGRAFRFLHVSSAFPRKGIDVLLEAYAAAFGADDDVTLVLKTFPNVHNETAKHLRALRERHSRCPDVILIDENLPAGQLVDLYRRCHAFVMPTRGEGFGLPVAEAMSFELPVVTTGFGGHRDFCGEDTCWPVDFALARARTHMALADSTWAEPDATDLARAMRAVYDAHPRMREPRIRRAAAAVEARCTWSGTAARLRAAIETLERTPALARRPVRVGWVTTWNSKCGIARYSRFLLDAVAPDSLATTVLASRRDEPIAADGPEVRRCWDDARHPDLGALADAIRDADCEAVVLQFNFVLFAADALARLLDELAERGIKTIVTFHSTRDGDPPSLARIRTSLARVDRLLVHGIADVNRLKALDLVDNVTLFPQGVLLHRPASPDQAKGRLGLDPGRPVVASYGFLLPPKGIEQLIEAFPAVLRVHPEAMLLLVNALYPLADSTALRDRCEAAVDRLGLRDRVRLVTEFLDDEESLCLLEAADLIVYPYQATDESSSAAVRIGLASGRPVACTPLPIFDDVAGAVHLLPGTDSAALAGGIAALLADRPRLASHAERQAAWLESHAWPVLARRFAGMVRALVNDPTATNVPGAEATGHSEVSDVQQQGCRNQRG